MLVSVVIPCYNSQRSIGEVVSLTISEFDRLDGYECEFVLVNDGSPADDTYGEICRLAQEYPNVHGINLMRNFGQHNAIMCGLNYAKGDLVLGMDDDLQNHPTQIPKLLAKMEEGDYDLVYGVFEEQKNSKVKTFTSWLNKVTARKMLGRSKDVVTSSFWLINRKLRDQVVRFRNYNPMIEALFSRMTDNVGCVVVEHHAREYGSSGYTLGKLVKLWLAYFNYTVLPLRAISGIGVVTAIVGFVFGIVTVIRKLIDPSILAGWASITSILLFFFGLVLLALGIIGEYVGDIVLSVNSTPQYIVRDTVNL
ncbi:glycosyltransferase family 2 protein [Olsenella sp. CA-Schmier-601-WT-1]|jgi:glycosyltransferase involved in cell wall biosynthesis|uniref:Glycosyltransferase family 2 protein n=2 Tax=Olsenella porci TaxID=2652279 RepID=A0A6N7XNS7_9ACTN|nr:glycosyltransferase family 2 protein [Olsenella sp.]MST71599.1 glycosyltransferase family 2 protein [Olsenella porci]